MNLRLLLPPRAPRSRRTPCSHSTSHRHLAAPPKSCAVPGGCSVLDVLWAPRAELLHIHGELSLALVSVGIPEPPGHLAAWTALVTLSSGPGSSSRGPSLTASSRGRSVPWRRDRKRRRRALQETSWSQWPFPSPLPRGKRSKGCNGLCPSTCGNICQQHPFGVVGSGPLPHGTGSLA